MDKLEKYGVHVSVSAFTVFPDPMWRVIMRLPCVSELVKHAIYCAIHRPYHRLPTATPDSYLHTKPELEVDRISTDRSTIHCVFSVMYTPTGLTKDAVRRMNKYGAVGSQSSAIPSSWYLLQLLFSLVPVISSYRPCQKGLGNRPSIANSL
jgi:hypothetical protein